MGDSGGLDNKASAYSAGTRVRSLGWEDPLEKEMATHSSIHAWKIPWTEEPGGMSTWTVAHQAPQSMGSQSWTRLSDFTFTFIRLNSFPKDCNKL